MAGVLLGDGGRGSIAGGYLWDVLEQTDQTDPGAGPGPGRELLDILGGATELLVLYGCMYVCGPTLPCSPRTRLRAGGLAARFLEDDN